LFKPPPKNKNKNKNKIKLIKANNHIHIYNNELTKMKDLIQYLQNLRMEKFILKTFKADYEDGKCNTLKDIEKFMTVSHLRDLQLIYCKKYPRFTFELFKSECLKTLTQIRDFFKKHSEELEFKSNFQKKVNQMIHENKSNMYACMDELEEDADTDEGEEDADEDDGEDDGEEEEEEEEDDDNGGCIECDDGTWNKDNLNDNLKARHNMFIMVMRSKQTPSENLSDEGKKFFELLKKRSKTTSNDKYFDSLDHTKQTALVDELTVLSEEISSEPLMYKVLNSKLPIIMKNEILNRIENGREHEQQKYTTWLDGLLRLPLGINIDPSYCSPKIKSDTSIASAYLDNAKKQLDKAVYGHSDAKHKLLQFISQRIKNNDSKGLVLGIQGPYGNGKTTMIEKGVSKVMGLPFVAIPLGGASDASFLNGHGFTYEGSVWGQIASVLMKAKSMNPIIYLDELDKISDTPKGREIVDQLVHMIDPSQNKHFQDRYFHGLDIDLTKVTWVFSYNDSSKIPAVLRDRITEVNTNGFTLNDKLQITNEFLIPSICKEVGLETTMFNISDDVIKHIINTYTFEGGVRKLKECLFDILRDINMDSLRGDITLPNKRRRTKNAHVFEVNMDSLRTKFLKHRNEITIDVVHSKAEIGRINGLYACSNDMGGITPIETQLVPSDVTFGLSLTGNLGKVMKESAHVAKTLAWSKLTLERKAYWHKKWSEGKSSVHIHCPEGAMSKDGPSAGTALTLCIISMLTGNKIRNDVALTGEMNLSGDVLAIGGLRSKLYGAKAANCKFALFPKQNIQDYNKIKEECPDLFDEHFYAKPISHLHEALSDLLITTDHLNDDINQNNVVKKTEDLKREAGLPLHKKPIKMKSKQYNLRSCT